MLYEVITSPYGGYGGYGGYGYPYQEDTNPDDDQVQIRITSYNVCYTKLLRNCFLRGWMAKSITAWVISKPY